MVQNSGVDAGLENGLVEGGFVIGMNRSKVKAKLEGQFLAKPDAPCQPAEFESAIDVDAYRYRTNSSEKLIGSKYMGSGIHDSRGEDERPVTSQSLEEQQAIPVDPHHAASQILITNMDIDKSSISGDFKMLNMPNIYNEDAMANFDETWLDRSGSDPNIANGEAESLHRSKNSLNARPSQPSFINETEVILEEDEEEASQETDGQKNSKKNCSIGSREQSEKIFPRPAETPKMQIPKLSLRKNSSGNVADPSLGKPIRRETLEQGDNDGDFR